MEYKELELLWKRYDEKLDSLERINKKLLKDRLLEKPRKKINLLELENNYSLIALPIIIVIALYPYLTPNVMDWKFILGSALVLGVVIYLYTYFYRSHRILRKMDIDSDTAIQSLRKVSGLKSMSNNLRRSVFVYYPLLFAGIILMCWNSFDFTLNKILVLTIFFAVTYYFNIWGNRKYRNRIKKLERDITELEEYSDQ